MNDLNDSINNRNYILSEAFMSLIPPSSLVPMQKVFSSNKNIGCFVFLK